MNLRVGWCRGLVSLAVALSGCGESDQTPDADGASHVGAAKSDRDSQGASAVTAKGSGWTGPTGTLVGTVRVKGAVGEPGFLDLSGDGIRDREVCTQQKLPDESFLVGSDGGLQNCFVYLRTVPEEVRSVAAQLPELTFDQQGCRFVPHAMVVRTGQLVRVLNDDPVGHNTHTLPLANPVFNQVNQPRDRQGFELQYARAERVPVQVVCDLHPWMRAYHLVVDHPYAGVTDDQGRFRISGLPVGQHTLRVWHERVGDLDRSFEFEVAADRETEIALEYPIEKFQTKVTK